MIELPKHVKSKQLPLRVGDGLHFGGYWLPKRTNPFIIYEDSDLPMLEYCWNLRPAQRSEGRTTRLLIDASKEVDKGGTVYLVCRNLYQAQHLLDSFVAQNDKEPSEVSKAKLRATYPNGGIIQFLGQHNLEALRGRRFGSFILIDHSVYENVQGSGLHKLKSGLYTHGQYGPSGSV